MNVNGLLDCHTHCMFSPDGNDDPVELVNKAVDLGLKALAVTDHCECNTWFEPEYYGIDSKSADEDDILMYNCKEYHNKSLEKMQELEQRHYDDGFEFIHGVELGQPLQAPEIAREITSDKSIDYIIGSLHNNSGEKDFYFLSFDGIQIDNSRYKDISAEIFRTLIAKGKGIEINTSSLFTHLASTMPGEELVRLYRDLGGEILSLGSDAHCAENVGQGIDIGAQLAKSCGFKYAAYFKQHKPYFISL